MLKLVVGQVRDALAGYTNEIEITGENESFWLLEGTTGHLAEQGEGIKTFLQVEKSVNNDGEHRIYARVGEGTWEWANSIEGEGSEW